MPGAPSSSRSQVVGLHLQGPPVCPGPAPARWATCRSFDPPPHLRALMFALSHPVASLVQLSASFHDAEGRGPVTPAGEAPPAPTQQGPGPAELVRP